MKKKMLLYLLL